MYLSWNQQTITDLSNKNINALYNEGYVFTRLGKGVMNQTRSVRVDLSKFKLSSENKRILKKTEGLKLETAPLPYTEYDWTIGKMGKDFYEKKFALNQTLRVGSVFTANKIKELMTDEAKSNFNLLLSFSVIPAQAGIQTTTRLDSRLHGNDKALGFVICRASDEILHYCYPFYDLDNAPKDTGLGMMTRAIVWAKENGKKYVYLGSFSRPTDTYKLQFEGIEWFDGKNWSKNINSLKNAL